MARCVLCHEESALIAGALGVCGRCAKVAPAAALAHAREAHARARRPFGLPSAPPRSTQGARCRRCANECVIGEGEAGYCGVRRNHAGRLIGGGAATALVSWYHDPLPTNCVASWVCPAETEAGYPVFTRTRGPEYGYQNLAVFYHACSFDCLFCQNWHYRQLARVSPSRSAQELASAVGAPTTCICYFGGDPSPQVLHALRASRLARRRAAGRILRVCWETNGSVHPRLLDEMAKLSLESGGCIKFDLKAWDDNLHQVLTGVSNRRTLENFARVAALTARRPDPPLLVASTLLVPGYVDAEEVEAIAKFIASLDPSIPYSLLAFHPEYEMSDLPTTSRKQAERCLEAARRAGLERIHLGNIQLLDARI